MRFKLSFHSNVEMHILGKKNIKLNFLIWKMYENSENNLN